MRQRPHQNRLHHPRRRNRRGQLRELNLVEPRPRLERATLDLPHRNLPRPSRLRRSPHPVRLPHEPSATATPVPFPTPVFSELLSLFAYRPHHLRPTIQTKRMFHRNQRFANPQSLIPKLWSTHAYGQKLHLHLFLRCSRASSVPSPPDSRSRSAPAAHRPAPGSSPTPRDCGSYSSTGFP